jgi:opacity protein-like surface antigen
MKKLVSSSFAIGILVSILNADAKYEVGLGVNSALIGVTANWEVVKSTELFAGIGLGAVVGARYYINDQFRLNASYGTQGYGILEDGDDDKIEVVHGLNIGVDYDFGEKDGWNAGLAYNLTSNYDDLVDEYKAKGYETDDISSDGVKLSLGYRF